MRIIACNGGGKDLAGARRRLEPARSPAAIDIKTWHRGLADDGRSIGSAVPAPAPVAQHAPPPECPKHLADWFEPVPRNMQCAGLRIRPVLIGRRPDHE